MKLLRLIGGLGSEHGGPPVSSVNACIAAQRAGAETTFAFPMDGDPCGALADTLTQMRDEGVRINHFPYSTAWGRRGESWDVSSDLARWIKRDYQNYDLIHCHGAWQMVTYHASRRAGEGPPVVLTPHESMTNFDLAQSSSILTGLPKNWLRRYYRNLIDLFVMSSQLEARDSLPGWIDGSGHCTVIPHPVYDETKEQSAQNKGEKSRANLQLGYLGRVHAKKNVHLILEAMQGMDENISLSIAGNGPELDPLKSLSMTLGVDHRINWLGFIDHDRKQQFFREINVLVMPSNYECFGMAAAEAMTHGVPVITSPDIGIAEIIREHGGGDIVQADADSLRAAIETLLQAPETIIEQGKQAAHNSLSFSCDGAA